ncbi:hypothetical protein [Spongiactinospora sp. TRM90649]|uniref:hypothetical protein n=1 Tax=Spongiactinospora sp. TRM90649 TaxID=3031114 RepID=UPI0023F7E00B|nr:hypothetical protein [Spongiactinospora sp. TRM90649]MDF5759345.1 hypothetical protein [Spongiactinospora sp. TRM90649]
MSTLIRPVPGERLILLDVDGVVNAAQRPANGNWLIERVTPSDGETYPIRYCPDHGRILTGLARETGSRLVWATT